MLQVYKKNNVTMEIKQFDNSLIAFDFEKEMINATDMAKVYNKRPVDFLRLESTKRYIKALETEVSETHNEDIQVVKTIKGGNLDNISQGTWMYKYLAYDFAAWLNPKFKIFVYKTFDKAINEKLKAQQRELDYFWDREDNNDLYNRKN